MTGTSKLPEVIVASKRQAALDQIMAAVEMYARGGYDCAITLAGAAEDSLPDHPRSAREFALTANVPAELANTFYTEYDRKERSDFLNEARNWLKHHKPRQVVLEIHRIDAEMMIFRAITKLDEPLWRLEREYWPIAWFLKRVTAYRDL